MTPVKSLVILLIVLAPGAGWAARQRAPDPELLEYLGSFATSSGNTVDPLLFSDDHRRKKEKEPPEKPKTERASQTRSGGNTRKDPDHEK